MGRHLKNDRLRTAGFGTVMPTGSTSLRPYAPVDGEFRFNTDNNLVEVYYSNQWNTLTREGPVVITKDTFTGTSLQTQFTMSKSYAVEANNLQNNKVIVVVGNVFQNPTVAYGVSGSILTFTSAPPFGQTIIVLHGYASTVAQ
jgi:hypothetical protein